MFSVARTGLFLMTWMKHVLSSILSGSIRHQGSQVIRHLMTCLMTWSPNMAYRTLSGTGSRSGSQQPRLMIEGLVFFLFAYISQEKVWTKARVIVFQPGHLMWCALASCTSAFALCYSVVVLLRSCYTMTINTQLHSSAHLISCHLQPVYQCLPL